MQELWLPIEGYEGCYEVSNLGRVKSLSRPVENSKRIIKEKFNSFHLKRDGYHSILLSKNKIKRTISLHRIVAKAFLPNPGFKKFVNHIDGNKLNNCLNNLEWVSSRENSCHYYMNNNVGTLIGVHYRKDRNKYCSHIHVNKRKVWLGQYDTKEEAYVARLNYEKSNNILNKYI